MHDVFISYSRKDQAKAEEIRKILEDNGIMCWFAPDDIHGNRKFTKEIPQAIRSSKAFLLLLSENSQESKWVERELGEADSANIPIYTFFLEDCGLNDQFNFVLRFNQHYGFELGFEEQTRRLVRELKEEIAERAGNVTDGSENGTPKPHQKPAAPKSSGKRVWIAVAAVLVVIVAAVLAVVLWPKGDDPEPEVKPDPDGKYVIWNVAYSIALSGETATNEHYLKGEPVLTNGGELMEYENTCVWDVKFLDDGTVTISRNSVTLGVELGYKGVGLGGKNTSDKWKLIEAEDGKYYIRNAESGGYLEWYNDKKNWASYDKVNDQNRDLFLLKMQKITE